MLKGAPDHAKEWDSKFIDKPAEAAGTDPMQARFDTEPVYIHSIPTLTWGDLEAGYEMRYGRGNNKLAADAKKRGRPIAPDPKTVISVGKKRQCGDLHQTQRG